MISIWRRVEESRRINLYISLAFSCAISCGLLIWRIREYDTLALGFLLWNLILASIPFVISQWIVLWDKKGGLVLPALFLWLLFFPNAPYLATDLMHLSVRGAAPLWFDLALLLSFAWNGLMLGFISMLDVHRFIERHFGSLAGWLFTAAALFLGSLGIYIGRFLRWNSWDIFTRPADLIGDVLTQLLNPFDSPPIYAVTLLFLVLLMASYLVLRSMVALPASPGALAEAKVRTRD